MIYRGVEKKKSEMNVKEKEKQNGWRGISVGNLGAATTEVT